MGEGGDRQIRVGDIVEAPDPTNDQEAFGHLVIADFERRKCRSEFIASEEEKRTHFSERIGRGNGQREPSPAEHRMVGWVQLHAKMRHNWERIASPLFAFALSFATLFSHSDRPNGGHSHGYGTSFTVRHGRL